MPTLEEIAELETRSWQEVAEREKHEKVIQGYERSNAKLRQQLTELVETFYDKEDPLWQEFLQRPDHLFEDLLLAKMRGA